MQIFARQPIKSGSAVIPNLLHFVYSLVVSHYSSPASCSEREALAAAAGGLSAADTGMYQCITAATGHHCPASPAPRKSRGVTLDTGHYIYLFQNPE